MICRIYIVALHLNKPSLIESIRLIESEPMLGLFAFKSRFMCEV